MIDKKLESMYDDLFGNAGNCKSPETIMSDNVREKNNTGNKDLLEPDTDAINKTINYIFESGKSNDSNGGQSSAPPSDPTQNVQAQNSQEQTAQTNSQAQTAQQPEEETDPMEELDKLIGLTAIKHDVKELIAYVKVQKMRKDSGLKSAPVSLHLVFTGNPGTGKTTVARIIARLYKQIGVLSQGQLVEVDRSGLVAGYVGQTALKTQKKIEEAMGGILFIDEAYALAKEGNDFGQEAIDTILKAMEDNRADFVVIVAGYTQPMENFIESNPGLKSRFNKYIEFADYTMEELTGIFKMYCDKYEYSIDEENLARVTEMLRIKKVETIENFANAREARNLFEKIITNQARRISDMENPSVEDMKTILYEDLYDEILGSTMSPSEPQDDAPDEGNVYEPAVDNISEPAEINDNNPSVS